MSCVAPTRAIAPYRPVRFGPKATEMLRRPDGALLLRSRSPLGEYPARITERLLHWGKVGPERVLAAQRREGRWQEVTYAGAVEIVLSLAQALLDRGLSPERPVAILSDNSIEHLLLALAAQHVGVPVAPISPAYSLVSTDFAKLRYVLGLATPGLVFVQSGKRFALALEAAVPDDVPVVVAGDAPQSRASISFDALAATRPTAAVEAAFHAVGPDTIAKILFTSGSTGNPKGVINTQRMLCANQQQIAQAFAFLADEPPAILDWLPWNHTFGGNHNVGMVLWHGGTLHIDDGKPVPGGIEKTVANLRDIAPTLYFNVPKGFEELVGHLRRDAALRTKFFSRLKMLFYAGAGMPQHVWDALEDLAIEATGERVPIVTGLGCTESAPSALFANWAGGCSGLLGVPVAGLELKLVANGDKLEALYRGPNVTPGYWREPALTRAAFDAEGFYYTGDALRLVDPDDPEQGLVFDGRIAEDFKLDTGTWVNVGILRTALVSTGAPVVQDAVIAGHDRDCVTAIVFPNLAACRALCPEQPAEAAAEAIVAQPAVRARLQHVLDALARQATGSASRIQRAVIAAVAPSIDKGEITDKGSLNQRAVLGHRADLVALLYQDPPPGEVLAAMSRS